MAREVRELILHTLQKHIVVHNTRPYKIDEVRQLVSADASGLGGKPDSKSPSGHVSPGEFAWIIGCLSLEDRGELIARCCVKRTLPDNLSNF